MTAGDLIKKLQQVPPESPVDVQTDGYTLQIVDIEIGGWTVTIETNSPKDYE